jgi:L-threonylcarbamoyladenylate synthase
MILKKRDELPYETTGGLDTVAIRMPSHPVAAALIRESGGFIAAPSANTSGRPSPTRAEHVAEDLTGRIPYLIDGGEVGLGIESTIIDLSVEEPMILRPGSITADSLSEVIGTVKADPGLKESDANIRPKAPGMKYRHYAPRAELILVEGSQEDVTARINELTAGNTCCGVICSSETRDLYRTGIVKCIGSRQDPKEIARHLYGILREFDALGVERIYSEVFSDDGVGTAVMNRLEKAAGHRRIRAR